MKHNRRILWLLHRAVRAQKLGAAPSHPLVATLGQLKNSARPLLFAGMPSMLRDNGRTAAALENKFRYIEDGMEAPRAVRVTARRWNKALATARLIAYRRGLDRRR